jgi:hypothetical protein
MRSSLDDAVVLAALATLTTMIMLGLGFLYRPRRATLLWSLMFILVMLSAYGGIVAAASSLTVVADVAAGLILGAPALVWSGLRADRGAPSRAWVAPVQCGASAIALVAVHGTAVDALTYSILYSLSALMAAMTVVELLRLPEKGAGRTLPLTAISAILPLIAAASVVTSAMFLVTGMPAVDDGGQSVVLPDLKAMGMIIYLTCAIVTLLSLARYPGSRGLTEEIDAFGDVAPDRLARAEKAGETGWSLLVVGLDDVEALRTAGGDAAFRRIVARFAADVRASFPAEADIGVDGPSRYLILIHRPDGVVRDCIRELLDRLSTVAEDQPLAVEFSASIGWATARDIGYDLAALTDAALEAAERAHSAGGHRWERAAQIR